MRAITFGEALQSASKLTALDTLAKGAPFSLAGFIEHLGGFALDILEDRAARSVGAQIGKADAACPPDAAIFAHRYVGFDPRVEHPSGARGAHVFSFPTTMDRKMFVAETGGEPDARAILRRAKVLKYDPGQPRDDSGKWTDGSGGRVLAGMGSEISRGADREVVTGMLDASDDDAAWERVARQAPPYATGPAAAAWARGQAGIGSDGHAIPQPVDQHLNDASKIMASKLFPGGYDVSPTAPNTYEDLVKHYAATGRMEVWSGGSDKTIFGDPEANYAFRAWHDMCHLRGNFPFTEEGELGAFNAMKGDVLKEFGDSPQSQHMIDLLHEEIIGQLGYTKFHNGDFPVDQRAFAAAYLKDPEGAVRMTFKMLVDAQRAASWGRLRDQASPPKELSLLSRLVAGRLQHGQIGKVGALPFDLAKYSPDQERDDRGRWTGVSFASPSIHDKDLPTAITDLSGQRHQLFEKASREIDDQLGLHGEQHGVVGAWKDGAENSTMLETHSSHNAEALRLSASMKGYLGAQKAVLVFQSDPNGPHAFYDMRVNEGVDATHQALLKAGVPFHTLVPSGTGTRVLVVDTDGSLGQGVGDFAVAHGTQAVRTAGNAEFIGDDQGTGSDAEQRARARDAYERVIESSPQASRYRGRSARDVWAGLRHRWTAQLEAVKRAGLKTLYVRRQLLNAQELHDWAAAAGIQNLVPPEEMHVTQVYSRTPADLDPLTDPLTVAKRHVAPLGDKGAVVLHFDSPELQASHRAAMEAGASHDFPSYQTHVTLSYDGGGADLGSIGAPTFPLQFGPEIHEPLNENWAEEKGLRVGKGGLISFAGDGLPDMGSAGQPKPKARPNKPMSFAQMLGFVQSGGGLN